MAIPRLKVSVRAFNEKFSNAVSIESGWVNFKDNSVKRRFSIAMTSILNGERIYTQRDVDAMSRIHEIVNSLVARGISVTVEKSPRGVLYDLNTGAKSHLHLLYSEGLVVAYMRYDMSKEINSMDDIYGCVLDCIGPSGYLNPAWRELLLAEGLIE